MERETLKIYPAILIVDYNSWFLGFWSGYIYFIFGGLIFFMMSIVISVTLLTVWLFTFNMLYVAIFTIPLVPLVIFDVVLWIFFFSILAFGIREKYGVDAPMTELITNRIDEWDLQVFII